MLQRMMRGDHTCMNDCTSSHADAFTQDPYHGPGQAEGWSFSVPHGLRTPASLQNIYKEIAADVGGTVPKHGHLEHWVKQGVLLLNTSLTVEV
jgi:uracil-DNA glycosylase